MSHPLRSQDWFGRKDKLGFIHRSWMKTEGFSDSVFRNKPVIGICNSWSELTNCNAHLRQVAEAVKRGVWTAGGFPLEFPTISLGEPFMRPTSMMFRNLMAMDVEESIRANPLDGVVLLCGCDKTTPAQLMGAGSAGLPAIMVTGGPMLRGMWQNKPLGSGTDVWHYWDELRAGRINEEEWCELESCMSRSTGHCMVMGTASTMTSLAEAMGMTLTGCASIPAADSRRNEIAERSGARIVAMVRENLTPDKIITRKAIENAIRVNMAIGGSTNAIIHLKAVAGRLGIDLPLSLYDEISNITPVIANIRPSGEYLMEDLFYAGGVPAVMKQIESMLHHDALTVTGKTMGEEHRFGEVPQPGCDSPARQPLADRGRDRHSLRQSLSGRRRDQDERRRSQADEPHGPGGGVQGSRGFQWPATTTRLSKSMKPVSWCSRTADPKGGPGMPEYGNLPIPAKLLKKGVSDMVRISDSRMSGTSYGTGRAAHLARVGGGRTPVGCSERRRDSAGCGEPPA